MRYVFDWKTDRLCLGQPLPSNESRCVFVDTDTGDVYDLSPLIRTSSNYKAIDAREGNKYEYDINVCRPLVDDGSLPTECKNQVGAGRDRHNTLPTEVGMVCGRSC
eukprot:TRINITY_DN663_c0_g1_i2.p1 TRINITY_DN663_c0_g1~~TRINITY_DN663_c0_g1_i2.p1  ORF type:complete len:106 (+),score=25.08 TRINITY_DN663_c0_g1_i2:3-320(+)